MVKSTGRRAPDTRTRILDAADEVFVERGTDGARMQEIADRARVNKALLHYHFGTKAELARAAWLRVASPFLGGVFEMMASDASLEEKIERFVDAYFAMLARHPYLPAYVLSELTRRPELAADFITAERRRAARGMLRKLRAQIRERTAKGARAPASAEQFLVTLASACIFPFAARPMLSAVLGLGPAQFGRFLAQRRKHLPGFFQQSLRP
jgi:TetR/AcrR family transcriptional regulator